MPNPLVARGKHIYEVVLRHLWRLAWVLLFGVVGGVLTWRDELLPENIKSKWRVLKMLPHWDWGWWVLIFATICVIIIFEASYQLRIRADAENLRLRSTLEGISLERPIAFDNIHVTYDSSGPPHKISSIGVCFKNLSINLMEYTVTVNSFYFDGRLINISPNELNHGHIHKDIGMRYTFNLLEPVLSHDGMSVIIDFDISYDNVPSIKARSTGRRVAYTFRSIIPSVADSLILDSREH